MNSFINGQDSNHENFSHLKKGGYLHTKTYTDKDGKDTTMVRYNKKALKDAGCTLGEQEKRELEKWRSVIIIDDGFVAASIPKAVKYEEKSDDIQKYICEEIIEGTMINMFYDKRRGCWEYATKGFITARCKFNTEKTFRELFLEVFEDSGLKREDMNKEYSYSFVFQHPENRIVCPVEEMRLYLMAVFKCSANKIERLTEIKKLHTSKEIKIYYPVKIENIPEEREKWLKKWDSPGIMYRHRETMERTKQISKAFLQVKELKGNSYNDHHRFLKLKFMDDMNQHLGVYLFYFPEDMKIMNECNEQFDGFVDDIYERYVKCFITKKEKLKDQDYEYKPILYKLQAFWLSNVKPEHMNEEIVEEFLRTMPVESVMFAMNYKKRPDHKKHKPSEEFEIINKEDFPSYKDELENDLRIKGLCMELSDSEN